MEKGHWGGQCSISGWALVTVEVERSRQFGDIMQEIERLICGAVLKVMSVTTQQKVPR